MFSGLCVNGSFDNSILLDREAGVHLLCTCLQRIRRRTNTDSSMAAEPAPDLRVLMRGVVVQNDVNVQIRWELASIFRRKRRNS